MNFSTAYHRLRSKLKYLPLKKRIILFYALLIGLSIIPSVLIVEYATTSYLKSKISSLSINEIQSGNNNLENLIEDINTYSKALLANNVLQEILLKGARTVDSKLLDKELGNYSSYSNKISSIYIYSNQGDKFYIDKISYKPQSLEQIKRQAWYQQVLAQKGGYQLVITDFENKPYLTFARIINDRHTYSAIGLMLIHIDQPTLQKVLNVGEENTTWLRVQDQDMVFYPNPMVDGKDYLDKLNRQQIFSQPIELGKGMTFIAGANTKHWKLMKLIPLTDGNRPVYGFYIAIILIFIVNAIIILIGSFLISNNITVPIYQLLDSIDKMEKGELKLMQVSDQTDEITRLKKGYNFMLLELQYNKYKQEQATESDPQQPKEGDLFAEIEAYITDNLTMVDLSLQKIAEHFYLNPSYLSRLYKQRTGISFKQYVTKARLEQACELIRTTDWKVYQISDQVGFSDAGYFSACFKKHMKLSVSDYRKKIEESERIKQ